MGNAAEEHARPYTWRAAAERLQSLYADLGADELVSCHVDDVTEVLDIGDVLDIKDLRVEPSLGGAAS